MIPALIEKRGLIIAIATAFIATILVVAWLNQQQQKIADELAEKFRALHENTIDAIYAKTDIPQGKSITEDMLYTRPRTKESLPSGAATSISRVIDRVAISDIKKDAMIMVDMIGWSTTQETTLAMRTPIGKRAITVSVDNIYALVGMIKPGDYVDVITLILLPAQVDGKQAAQPATVPLFQNVQVLAVGSQIGTVAGLEESSRRRRAEEESRPESSPLITLALSPEEANLLAFVQEQGKIRLVLRSPADAKTESVQPASWDTLLKYLFPQADFTAQLEVKEVPQVEVIRGFKREMIPLSRKE